ncbi:hypothetical protein DFH06DRAFT_523810 [Mycena polygramma]|nr:hypothetical protein DFH06DRAFT_523810 [Mycena polygramma]
MSDHMIPELVLTLLSSPTIVRAERGQDVVPWPSSSSEDECITPMAMDRRGGASNERQENTALANPVVFPDSESNARFVGDSTITRPRTFV